MSSRYETLFPIGTGGMAKVFLGRTHGADGSVHLVALKRAHAHVRADQKLAAGLKREARLASRLSHPNVVSVLDVEESANDLVLILDYVEGCTLRALLSGAERLGEDHPRETVRVILDIAAGLHAAHQATDEDGRLLGLVHRDVSPSNMLVGVDGVSRISDFGIAKALFEGEDKTETGVLKGKSSYMAPEYVLHQHANAASDLFSLAVIAWESLSGARLFKGQTELETLERVARAEIRPLASERPDLAVLDEVLATALARAPSDRHWSVQAFSDELEAVATAYGLVASHAEVADLVERAAHAELQERRTALGKDKDNTNEADTLIGQDPRERGRDRVVERILEPDTMVRSRMTRGHDESDTAIMRDVAEESLDTAVMARMERPGRRERQDIRRAHPTVRVRHPQRLRGRSRDRLVLAAAFALLALALTAMAARLATRRPAPQPPGTRFSRDWPPGPGTAANMPASSVYAVPRPIPAPAPAPAPRKPGQR